MANRICPPPAAVSPEENMTGPPVERSETRRLRALTVGPPLLLMSWEGGSLEKDLRIEPMRSAVLNLEDSSRKDSATVCHVGCRSRGGLDKVHFGRSTGWEARGGSLNPQVVYFLLFSSLFSFRIARPYSQSRNTRTSFSNH